MKARNRETDKEQAVKKQTIDTYTCSRGQVLICERIPEKEEEEEEACEVDV